MHRSNIARPAPSNEQNIPRCHAISQGGLYGLIGSCKLNGINLRAYPEYVLTHIADHPINRIDELLPWNVASKLPKQAGPAASIA